MKPLALLALLATSACAGTGTMTPLNQAAERMGTPKMELTKYGLGHGPVTFTMPDGEVLTGTFQQVGVGALFVSAKGPRSTLACQGNVGTGHGGGVCRIPSGAEWQMVF